MRVLIAEDDRISRRMLQRQLERWGHEVVAASNGREAWETFQNGDYPIVVSDWMMPEMDGLELVRRIRNCQRDAYVFVILLTAKSAKDDIVAGMEAGADDFLSKPFDRNELRVRLRAGERIITLERSLAQRNQVLHQANERMKRDLEAAARVQQSLLPTSLPEVSRAKFAWNFKPCDELAGDFLNMFQLDGKHIGLYVADVSGHGVAASLLSVTISRVLTPQPSISSLLVKPDDGPNGKRIIPPAQVATELNKRFPMEESGDRYFTIAYGVLNTETCEFRYVSAGHPPIIQLSPHGEAELLKVGSTPIGCFPEADYEEQVVQLRAGDRLCIYSDGLPEAMNSQFEQFGQSRLIQSLARSKSCTLENGLSRLLREIEQWCGDEDLKDDVSVLTVEIL
ncbi:MAG: PP2C family protein-serine/threonine phosphatase [Planctomycetota bacterium]